MTDSLVEKALEWRHDTLADTPEETDENWKHLFERLISRAEARETDACIDLLVDSISTDSKKLTAYFQGKQDGIRASTSIVWRRAMTDILVERAREKIGELVGEASMCWDPPPLGVFESDRASRIVDDLTTLVAEAEERGYNKSVQDALEETPCSTKETE